MTDQELLQLLEDKSPQDLSLDELRLLKQRLAESPALRDALAGQLGIDGNLAAALGRVDVSPEKLLARASVGPRKRRRSWAVAIMGVALLIAGIVVTVARRTGEDETPGTVARSNGNSPDENGAGDKSGEPADAAKSNDAATSSVTGTPGGNEPDPNVPAVSGAPAPPIAPPVAAVAPAPALPPWHDVLAAAYQPPAFADVCFESFDVTKSLPQRGDLEKWFEPVAGQSLRIADTNSALGKCVVLQGVARLKAPLGGDRALRVWMENYQRIQIHLFSGDRGVTLTFHEDDYFRWSAYATTRVAESPLPNTWALATTDDNRNRRTEIRVGGPMELRHRDGEVILSRGDVVLLRAALDGPPTDVYFAGNALFHGITLVRTKDFPRGVAAEADANKTRLAERKNVTAELAWKEQLGAGARVEKLADGAVRLVADGAKARGWLSAPLPKVGLHEIVLQLEDVTSGAGISLARDNERPALTLRFVNDKRHNGLALVPCPDDDAREVTLQPIAERFQPLRSGRGT